MQSASSFANPRRISIAASLLVCCSVIIGSAAALAAFIPLV